MHDRELKLSETFRDFLRLFKTFKSQKRYGKHEVLHGKGEVLWTIQIRQDEEFEESPRIKKVALRTKKWTR